MFLRVIAILLAVIGLTGVALALIGLNQRSAAPAQVTTAAPAATPVTEKRLVLAAARPQRAGNLLVAEDVTAIEVPLGQEPVGSFVDSVSARTNLRGAMVRRSINAGEVIVAGDVLNPGDRGFLAAVLGAGMRAVTVAVDAVSGTAGLIWPGDRVDMVLTQEIEDREQPVDRRVFGETALTNLRVIAVDQQLVQGGQGGQGGIGTLGSTVIAPSPNGNRTVTIEASLYDAERIAVASRLGKISLVVRSAADDPQVGDSAANAAASVAPPVAWAGDVSPGLRDSKNGKSGNSIHLYHGAGAVDEVKF
jgi:pilus assembly protein CpaB